MAIDNLTDIGANLTHDSFAPDRDAVIDAAVDAGVRTFIVAGASIADSHLALTMAKEQTGRFFATAGVHPHHAKEWQPGDEQTLRELARDPLVRAVGECGLDHCRNFSTPQEQEHAFRAQLQLAAELGKPVYLHQRDAHTAFLAILDDYLDALPRAVAHCFTGDERELDDYLQRGLYIGITGWICDERRGHHLRELVARIPRDRLMVETDAPYLLPRDLRPKPKSRRNEPKHLPHVLRAVAAAGGYEPADLAASTTAAAKIFFDLPD